MDKANLIIERPIFKESLKKINALEENRVFCRHGMDHFVDVARIAWILALEGQVAVDKELVYAAAYLHDIGRHMEYEQGVPHEKASAAIASQILLECGFGSKAIGQIIDAILSHRSGSSKSALSQLLFRADKLSRRCFECDSFDECDWDVKNGKLEY